MPGTALNVFHSDLDRLSVDIDVNYVGAVEGQYGRPTGRKWTITGKLTMCLHDRYFDAFGGPAAWIENVTAECREKLAPVFFSSRPEEDVAGRACLDAVVIATCLLWRRQKTCAPR